MQQSVNASLARTRALLSNSVFQFLFKVNPKDTQNLFLCGGTIIAKRFVITAAHCLYPGGTRQTPDNSNLEIIVGEHTVCAGNEPDEGGSLHSVFKVHVHPMYNNFRHPDGFTYPDNDIAILEVCFGKRYLH